MKKGLLLSLFVLFPYVIKAQDIIHTIAGETIIAKILEIDRIITYKEYNYQDGPIYRLSINEVASIVLQNGTEKVFRAIPKDLNYPNSISVHRGDLYGDGNKVPENIIPFVLGDAGYKSFKTASTLRNISKPLLIAGASVTGVSAFAFITFAVVAKAGGSMPPTALITSFYVLGVAGVTSLVTSIPLFIISRSMFNNVVNNYNNKHQLSLNISATQNGVGLCLVF